MLYTLILRPEGKYARDKMSLDEPAIPHMFRPDSFPSFLTFEEGPDYEGPPSLAGRKMETPANIFNRTFNSAVGKWGLPPPEIEEGTDGDVGQSDAEIVQQIYLKARGPCQQFEMFFSAQPLYTQRNSYGQANRVPYEGITLHEMQLRLVDNATAADSTMFFERPNKNPVPWNSNDVRIKYIVQKYNPMGFFFAYVEDRVKNMTGMDIAYTSGSLCDISNIWHVPIVPGMQLYVLMMWVNDGSKPKKMLVPYASLGRPEDDPYLKAVNDLNANEHKEWALIDIGTVCVASNQPSQMQPGYSYVCQPGPLNMRVPSYKTATMGMTTDPVQIKHNILRVNVNMLQWEYKESF